MLRIFHNTTFDFIKWWRWAAGLTAAFIAIGLASYAVNPSLNYSIEFTGGTLMQLEFQQAPDPAELRSTVGTVAEGAEIQQYGSPTEYTVRAQGATGVESADAGAEGVGRRIGAALQQKYGAQGVRVVRTEAVGARVGEELSRGAIVAVLLGSVLTLIYLAIRFEWRFGLAAVLATGHDILVTAAFIKLFHIEVSLTVVAAILTLLGYSMNDTIIIFDRVREDLRLRRKEPLRDTLNRAINETLPRSVLTHATTLAATLALLLFAGEVIRPFAAVMAFGIFVATFSSIYVAGPLLLWIERKWPRRTIAGTAPRGTATPDRGAVRPEQPVGAR
ncbi:protein translocase subunit SecF [Roseisolibacter sp. H3M3-2]|uniref:protein translocase subunit SecF n=1 Tax=Roseisolibacter sp. H3M3-2 TaxID=3031323 RepID=UPI0023DAD928|nr:protein translocase subunit SecF [Roseisolibacter sp. H3M3-2]MDF1504106.1 protein translocase subunit SecF [Roseisolibacter sp. H3M3-2]